mmetsp:Transcript_9965/g.21144  ORF Transcript_9965/g.21144 Transcript_9965/m.21144 type:complete len:347 (-) Transcript_9965:242-1282(-)
MLDPLVELHVVLTHDRHRTPRTPRARGAPHAVDVVLRVGGELVVDHQVDRGDIEPSARHVRRDENRPLARLELVERGEALGLRELAVERDGGEAERAEHERDPLHGRARRGEDDGGVAGELIAHVREVAVLVLRRHEHVLLDELLDRRVLGGDLHLHRVAQARALQLLHLGSHRGGEEVCVPLLGRGLQDDVQLLLEVHVEELVGLVEHEELEPADREPLGVLQVVDQPAGRADDDVRLLGEHDRLLHHVHPSDCHRALHADERAERLELLADLEGELARRRDDEREQRLRLLHELVKDGQGEGGRLAGAGLRQADDVAPMQPPRQCLALDGGGVLEPHVRARLAE